jgi:plastocyanin
MKLAHAAALIIVLVLVTTILGGCGGDSDDKNKSATATQSASASDGEDDEIKLTLVAENTKFDKTTLEAPAGKDVTLTMENKDSVDHTFSLYQTAASTEKLAGGQAFSGPAFLTYQFTAPETPGTYHFQCDIHPSAMKGDFVVK